MASPLRSAAPPSAQPSHELPSTTQLDSTEGLETFKYVVTLIILVITVISALFPLWISKNGTSQSRQVLTKKLPFLTAGVFIGSGMMHLLPDAVKMYNKVLASSPELLSAKWAHEFPMMYLLSAVGCMIVWAVDLMNLGDSPKMIAVASAATPNHETSLYRVQIPRVASFGMRHRSVSADGFKQSKTLRNACSCNDLASPVSKLPFHKGTRTEETTFLLSPMSVKLVGDPVTRTYTSDRHHPSAVKEEDYIDDEEATVDGSEPVSTEATVSEHVVFSGQSPFLPYLLAALFSIHSLIAGFALGVNRTSNKTAIATAIAIFSHKVIEAMSVGANFARAKNSIAQDRSIAVLTLYSFMTPLGIILGMLLSSALQGTAVLVVESFALSIASGSFVYLAFHEMSDEHGTQDTPSVEKILLFGSGIFSMAALATWT